MRAIVCTVLVAPLIAACAQRPDESPVAVSSVSSAVVVDLSSLQPSLGCVSKVNATTWRATFGYESRATKPLVVSVGSTNGFSPAPAGRGQPERFDPGKRANAFSVLFDGHSLTWTVGTTKVTASSTSPACPADTTAANLALSGFVLYARTMVRLDGAQILGGDVGVADVGHATDGRDELSVEPNEVIDPTHRAFAATIDLRSGSTLGAVFTNRLDNQGGTVRSVSPFPATMPALPTLAPVTAGTTPISVPVNQTRSLGPGAYGLVHVDGTLTLTGGTYQLARLELGSGGRVEASAGAKIRVAGAIAAGPNSHLRTNPVGSARDLLVEVTGTGSEPAVFFDADSEVHALVTAPLGSLVFHSRAKATGAFVARDIAVSPSVVVQYEGGLPATAAQCMAALQLTSDQVVPGVDANDLPRMIAATACFAPDLNSCQVTFLANANFDMRSAAKQLIADLFSPAQYLWLTRDRTRKLLLARNDPTWAAAFCRGDADGDLVPDDRDTCPGTPPMTATDDHGCTNATLPPAPNRQAVQNGFGKLGMMASMTCDGVAPPAISYLRDVCLDRPNLRYLITVEKSVNQPTACGLFYELMTSGVEEGEPDETFRARLAYDKNDAIAQTADTLTFALPLVCDPTVETPGDGKSWPCDEVDGDEFDTVISVRATNGNGQQSVWGSPRETNFHLCH